VVDHVQSGIALLLLCPNPSDVRLQLTLLGFVRGSTTLPQMCELLPGLFDRQDAPDISALAVPPFRILPSWRGARVVALATMVRSPFLQAGGDPLGLPGIMRLVPLDLRLWAGDPAPFGIHRCPCSTVEADMETPERSIPRRGGALADTGW
jgi:hypothetical protein